MRLRGREAAALASHSAARLDHLAGREVIRKRLLLVLYALGSNVGIKRVADGGRHGESEAALRATRHLFVNRDNLRKAIATLVNATLKMRDPLWWGNGTACASDSKKFGSWPSNLMTEYHARYGDPATPPRSPR